VRTSGGEKVQLRKVSLDPNEPPSLAIRDSTGEWIPLVAALALAGADKRPEYAHLRALSTDVVAFLTGGERVREQALLLLDEVKDDAAGLGAAITGADKQLPFSPRSFRAFSIFDTHMIASSRVLVRRFFPRPAGMAIGLFERLTGRTAAPLKPARGFYEHPAMYMGNHTAFYADGDEIPWPQYSNALDFELELGFVVSRPVRDATEQQGRAAIGGFFLLNDFSARDTQADEYRHGVFGPVVRSKTSANSLGPIVVTADELGADAERLHGSVHVNGELWCEGTNAGANHSLGDMVAWASTSEQLMPGDVLSTGTFPGCCGLELDRWIETGDVVQLVVEQLGTLSNRIGTPATPARVEAAGIAGGTLEAEPTGA
jgi:2-keto-4-pentenoate hydratase/2-oxohepta-3-ene-1,7-dioic acid hydratase in catechol pathway